MEDFLSSGIAGHMTTTNIGVAVIQNPLSLLENQTLAENRISAEAVQGITNNAIGLGFVTNPSSSVFRHIGTKRRRLQINYNIPIPRVEGADEEQSFVQDMLFRMRGFEGGWQGEK